MAVLSRRSAITMQLVLLIALLPQFFWMPAWLSGFASLPIGWRVWATIKGRNPPGLILRLLAAFTGLAAIISVYGVFLGRRAGASLLAVMLALKLLESFRIRDARVIISLCFFMAATQFLFAQNVFMLVYGFAVVSLGLLGLISLQRDEAYLRAGADHKALREQLPSLFGPGITRVIALAVPMTLVLFFLFPRLASPLWGLSDNALDGKTGLSDSMAPGSIQSLFIDDSPAFRVTFNGPMPPPSERYWRGPVFWNFTGREWKPISLSFRRMAPDRLPAAGSGSYDYRVQLEPHERRWVFALDYPVKVPEGSGITMDYMLYDRDPVTSLKTYSVESNPNFSDSPELRAAFRDMALQVPRNLNRQTRQWVAELRREYPDNLAFIQQVLQNFRTQPFFYSLDPPPLGRNSVDDFMFNTREGYCEHYSSAFTIILRMARIPARVTTGYQGGYYSPGGGYLLVRQSDAHAWTEAWLPDRGWTRFDPTAMVAPERIRDGALAAFGDRRTWYDYAWLRQARNSLDRIQHYWNRWILAFDSRRQLGLFSRLGVPKTNETILVIAMLIAGGLVTLGLLPLIRQVRSAGSRDPAVLLYQKYLKWLRRKGVDVHPYEGALELAERAAAELPDQSDRILNLAAVYYAYRYGRAKKTGLDTLNRLVKALP